MSILLRHELLGVVLCLMGTDHINTANAQQTDQQTIVTKAEAALADKIKRRDFRKNANGTWTSGPNANGPPVQVPVRHHDIFSTGLFRSAMSFFVGGLPRTSPSCRPIKSQLGSASRQYLIRRFTNLNVNTWIRNGLQKRDVDVGVALHPDHYV
jgi:hypothetical protein